MAEHTSYNKKIITAIVGGLVLVAGIVMIPYPGPGWLVVFAGLAILSREFAWAGDLLNFARGKYDDWNDWIKEQNWLVKSLTFIFTSLVVIVTIWLLNGYGLINQWLDLGWDWVKSPFFK